MKEINIAAAQFNTRDGDKGYNLSRIEASFPGERKELIK